MVMLLWVTFVMLFAAAAPSDPAAIRAARIAQNRAIAAGELDRAAQFWTEDVTVRRALGQAAQRPRRGAQGTRAAAPPAAHLIYQRIAKDVEVSAKWPLAFETGTWEGHQGTLAGPVVIARPLFGAMGKARRSVADPIGSLRRAHLQRRRLRRRRRPLIPAAGVRPSS